MSRVRAIHLKKRPEGKPSLADFNYATIELPSLKNGEVELVPKYVSVDPYLRGRMRDAPSYTPPFKLDQPIVSGVVAEVTKSQNAQFRPGDFVLGMLPWQEKQIALAEGLHKVDPNRAPLSTYLGVLGMTGLTAYLGLTEIGKPKKGETIVVSGAAGAVGSTVGQIAKIMGLRVVGIAGSDEKVELIKAKFGFNAGLNYKSTANLTKAIKDLCPDGVDIYFDNVGGEISEAVLYNINKFSRTINCGAISVYNNTETPKSISVQPFLVKKSALMQGFIVVDFEDKFPAAMQQLSQWMQEGQLKYSETVREGFENITQAFIDLFEGKNLGKMVVKLN